MLSLRTCRLNWIQALRSRNFAQGHDNLVNPGPTFCCIGVAKEVAEPGWHRDLPDLAVGRGYDEDDEYDKIADYYEYNDKLSKYLIAMNDGMFVSKSVSGYMTYSQRGAMENTRYSEVKILRNTDDKRDFEFIARFLELAWKVGNE